MRFADDQGMVASTENGLQKFMDREKETSKQYVMKISVKKTKQWLSQRVESRECFNCWSESGPGKKRRSIE